MVYFIDFLETEEILSFLISSGDEFMGERTRKRKEAKEKIEEFWRKRRANLVPKEDIKYTPKSFVFWTKDSETNKFSCWKSGIPRCPKSVILGCDAGNLSFLRLTGKNIDKIELFGRFGDFDKAARIYLLPSKEKRRFIVRLPFVFPVSSVPYIGTHIKARGDVENIEYRVENPKRIISESFSGEIYHECIISQKHKIFFGNGIFSFKKSIPD